LHNYTKLQKANSTFQAVRNKVSGTPDYNTTSNIQHVFTFSRTWLTSSFSHKHNSQSF